MRIQPVSFQYNNWAIGKSVKSNSYNQVRDFKSAELSNVFYYPVNFTSRKKRTHETTKPHLAEKSGNFLLSKISDIPCPACGKLLSSPKEYEKFRKELAKIPSDEYLEFLGNYTQYMRPVEEQVYHELCNLSESLGDIEGAKDIRTLVVMLRDEKLPVLQEIQLKLINKMKALAHTLPENEKKVLLAKVDSLKSIIKNKKTMAPFRRKIMLDEISQIEIKNPHKYDKLQKIAKKFPTSTDMAVAWFVKYSGKNKKGEDWDSYTIATRLLSYSNTDHFIPYSEDNKRNDIGNYLPMHEACNVEKSNYNPNYWLSRKPERIKYLQTFFDYCNMLIKTRRISKKKYRKYVAYATENIAEATKGQVILNNNQTPETNPFMQ